jgi:mannitol-1-/sugar-/sorbitol-6-/2-deoxyglucose-6-phosphatase
VLIDTVLDSLGLRGHFDEIVSAQDEQRGKPDPAVFLSAARRLGVEPSRCVALEDSLFGVQAAKAAGMTCIAVPLDVPASERDGFHIADLVLSDLTELLVGKSYHIPSRTPSTTSRTARSSAQDPLRSPR